MAMAPASRKNAQAVRFGPGRRLWKRLIATEVVAANRGERFIG
jgi:hypothetical protein